MTNRLLKLGATVLAALVICFISNGCASSATASKSKEDLLIAAGFKTFPADTAAKKKLLNSMPAGKLSTVQRGGQTYYVYPHLAANSALVGTQKEFTNYQQLKNLNQISNRNLEQAESQPLPAASWGAWGGWGPGYVW